VTVRPDLVSDHLVGPSIFTYSQFMASSISRTEKRSRGRPRVDPTSIHLTLAPSYIEPLDAWIAEQPDPKPSRPEAIRRLLEIGLRQEFGDEDGTGALSAEGAFLRGNYPA